MGSRKKEKKYLSARRADPNAFTLVYNCFLFLSFGLGQKSRLWPLAGFFSVQGLNRSVANGNLSKRLFLERVAMGEKLGHYMWQNFVLVSVSIKSIAKGIHETFLFSGKIIFYCIGSIAICTKKGLAALSHSHYTNWHKFCPLSTLFCH